MKKLLSFIMILAIILCTLPLGILNASATMSATEIKQFLDTKKAQSGYIPGSAPPSSYTSGSGCYGFVDMLCRYLYGHGLPSQAANHYQFNNYGTNFTQVGNTLTVSGGNLTESTLSTLFSQAQTGDVIQMDYTKYDGNDSLHVMMVYSVTSTGVIFYHAGKSKVYFGASSGSQPLWGTTGNVLTWAKLKAVLKSSDDGISLYRSKQNGGGSSSGSGGSTSTDYGSTNPDDYTYPTETLKYTSPTMKGSSVAWVQSVLYQLGYSIDIDGSYGRNTVAVVEQFQSDYGLTVDGFCGPITRAKLLELWNNKKHTHNWAYSYSESAHPHCSVYTCSCGENYINSDSSNYRSDCASCNPVGASTVTLSSTTIAVGQSVTVSWTESVNTNSYTLKYYNDNNEYTTVCNTTSYSGEIVFTTAGNYYIYVDSIGVNNSYIQSNVVKVTVSDARLTIIYNANGGKIEEDSAPYIYLDDEGDICWPVGYEEITTSIQYGYEDFLYSDSDLSVEKEGHYFAGWSLDPNGGKLFDAGSSIKPEDIYPEIINGSTTVTLYAIWEVEEIRCFYYNWEFDIEEYMAAVDAYRSGEGKFVEVSKQYQLNCVARNYIIYGSDFDYPDAPVRKGYKFTGWKMVATPDPSDTWKNAYFFQTQYEQLSWLKGECKFADINFDDEINILDLVRLKKTAVKIEEDHISADLNSDGNINSGDIIILRQELLK